MTGVSKFCGLFVMCFLKKWILVIIVSLQILHEKSQAERLGDLMYQNVIGSSACFRRLNGTHQMGCSSPSSGSVGVIHVVKNEADAWWIVANGTAPPYMAVMSVNVFNKRIANHFIDNPSAVAGIILYYGPNVTDTKPQWYSLESTCPNEYSSAPGSSCSSSSSSSSNSWNYHGMDLMRRDIPFPIFYIPPKKYDDADSIIKCFQKFNAFELDTQYQRALCAVELNSFMFAASSSEVCYRRTNLVTNINSIRFCDPLADRNIYSTVFPRIVNKTKEDIILLTARLDSASFVDGLSPGAASTIAGLATFLSTAKLLSDMLRLTDASKYSKNIVFALFNGEAFDYIGSQRVAFDMLNQEWPPGPSPPLTDSSVGLHIEIGQIGGSIIGRIPYPITAYIPKTRPSNSNAISNFIETLSVEASNLNIMVNKLETDNLPPSSLHSFRRITIDGRTNAMPELLLTDHGEEGFTNRYYHSVLDDAENLQYVYKNSTDWVNQKYAGPNGFRDTVTAISDGTFELNSTQVKLANISTAIALAVYKQVTNTDYSGPLKGVSPQLIDEILFCYLVTMQCPLFMAALSPVIHSDGDGNNSTNEDGVTAPNAWTDFAWADAKDLPPPPYLYVGVSSWLGASTTVTALTLALLAGERVNDATNVTMCDRGSYDDDIYFNYYWMTGWSGKGECYRSTVNYTQALSPAFTITDYDFSSNEFSTWTESVWRSLHARMFVVPNGRGAKAATGLGVVFTLLTFAASIWVKRHAAALFGEVKTEEVPTVSEPRNVQC